ncbi:hypothetical protein ACIM8H_002516 [Staphylococcus aureus]|uniref:hypothetical protein n=1 Tax=Staphylococcus TaxID=1279 RepID=UPI00044BF425|nr:MULTISPECIES: hypothetical protein [Staphylococcus]MDW4013818.1 hypothetical protein [Staphylococcus saprophyticus]EVV94557.1 hypothetical protein U210_02844 [Staphylococcus aureus W24216]MDW4063918.1 hypothetical protein [Staphylococcus saprophyticus]MDW4115621.1 hypothetical protein [Staphylococcus saprophyticus]MDW4384988.1 hypothetical protein [Staphylococcus saprophyticus]
MNKNMIESYLRICENIKEYEQVEFDREYNEAEEVFDSSLQCPLAYTTKGDNEEFEIQVTLDLKNNRIIKELSHVYDNYIEYEYFKDWEEIATESEFINFEELIMTDVDVDDLLEEFANRQKLEDEKIETSTNYKNLLENMNKLEYKETIKAVFSFETGIQDETYLNSMADYFINDDTIHNFLDVELYEKQLEYYKGQK